MIMIDKINVLRLIQWFKSQELYAGPAFKYYLHAKYFFKFEPFRTMKY